MSLRHLQELSPIGQIGKYDLLGRLAVGGMAEIFLAREVGPRSASRELVVKRVLPHVSADERLTNMFVQEARLCMRLRHPNICPIYEFGEASKSFYLAMEWVHGVSLADLTEKTRLPIPVAVRLIADIAGALHYAHTAKDGRGDPMNIVHRDVSPENIMVAFDGTVRLLDFGIAKAATQTDKTRDGIIKGKFAYMSPEQYRAQTLDGRSDIFSLGICLWEALTGQRLYMRENEYETVAAIVLEDNVPTIRNVRPELPERLEQIVQRCLRKDANDRFRSAEQMQAALEAFLVEEGRPVRDSEIALLLSRLFPRLRADGPTLERKDISLPTKAPVLDEVELAALASEVDDVEESFAARDRRKRLAFATLALLVVLATVVAGTFLVLNNPAPEVETTE